MRVRLLVHALDRTGPPTLARSLLRWIRDEAPAVAVDVVAMRGGEQFSAFEALAPTRVMLEPNEAWDVFDPPGERIREVRESLVGLAPVDVTLLVSISGGEVLPFLDATDPVATWVVEQEEDFPPGVVERTCLWLAGSEGTRDELARRVGSGAPVEVCPEFVDRSVADPAERDACRAVLGGEGVVVVGAGIGTERKGMDLFLEVALAAQRRGLDDIGFVWIGGERDPLHPLVAAEIERLELRQCRLLPSVEDVVPWFAAADVFLHTARLDAFPLVCLHAACTGTPVVAFSGVGGVREMFGSSFVGAPYPDVEGLVSNLHELTDERRRHELGRAQQQQVTDRYVAERGAPLVLRHLAKVAS